MSGRFSESDIWRLQRRYYEDKGIEAWNSGEVPYYITSNPRLAHAYAAMIHGFIRDRERLMPQSDQPVHVIELGAGSGQLAFHILQRLELLFRHDSKPATRYRYIMSDLAEKNIEFWSRHPKLQPYFEQGVLDVCLMDAARTRELSLLAGETTIGLKQLDHPIVVIANYVFDSLPQDLFFFHHGKMYEGEVEWVPPEDQAEAYSEHGRLEYEYSEIVEKFYGHPGYDELLGTYREQLQSTHLLFPFAALDCLERLRELTASGELALLTVDKGDIRLEDLENRDAPVLVPHGGCFSLSCNFHALFAYYERLGAAIRFHEYRLNSLILSAVWAVSEPEAYAEAKLAYELYVEQFSPGDFYTLKTNYWRSVSDMDIRELLSWIRLSGYDAAFVWRGSDRLAELLPDAGEADRAEACEVLMKVWEAYYSIDEQQDLPFTLGLLLYLIDRNELALTFFSLSLQADPNAASTCYNIGLCNYALKDYPAALSYFERALELHPGHEGARRLIQHMALPMGESNIND